MGKPHQCQHGGNLSGYLLFGCLHNILGKGNVFIYIAVGKKAEILENLEEQLAAGMAAEEVVTLEQVPGVEVPVEVEQPILPLEIIVEFYLIIILIVMKF